MATGVTRVILDVDIATLVTTPRASSVPSVSLSMISLCSLSTCSVSSMSSLISLLSGPCYLCCPRVHVYHPSVNVFVVIVNISISVILVICTPPMRGLRLLIDDRSWPNSWLVVLVHGLSLLVGLIRLVGLADHA